MKNSCFLLATLAADGQGQDYEDDPASGGANEPETYHDEDDLYADIVPGIAQVDGVRRQSNLLQRVRLKICVPVVRLE